jgi:ABC-2 type transport system permease protein
MMSSLIAVVAKEYRQTFRDKRMIALLMLAPLIQLIIMGFAVNLEVDRVPTVIADEDWTPQSRKLADELTAGRAFEIKGKVSSGETASRLIVRGEVPLVVVIPQGFGENKKRDEPAAIQALVDGGDSNRAIVSQNAVMAFAMQRAQNEIQDRLRKESVAAGRALSLPQVEVIPRIYYNPSLDSRIYFVPGVAATLLLVITLITTAMGLAREKETGTLEQVMVSPIRPEILILGKTLPYGLIGLIDLGYVIAAGAWIFDVPIRGSLLLLFLAGALYMLTTLGAGLLVSALAKNQQQAFMGAVFFMMPAVLLSGFVTPVSNMPEWLQPFSGFTPVRHFVVILRSVLLKGSGFTELASHFVGLAGLGLVVYASSAYVIRRKLA